MNTHRFLFFFVVLIHMVVLSDKAESSPTPIQAHSPTSVVQARDSVSNRYLPKSRKTKRYRVAVVINVIYAHIRKKFFQDPALKRDLPVLQSMFDFNAYQLLKQYRYRVAYRQAIIVPISYRFQVQLSPTLYASKQKSMLFQVTFLYRKQEKNRLQARFTQYASMEVSLRSGTPVAFLGPSIQYGRSLITLRAKHLASR